MEAHAVELLGFYLGKRERLFQSAAAGFGGEKKVTFFFLYRICFL
jgi:hypothetical protein